jgi:hypothetical protein
LAGDVGVRSTVDARVVSLQLQHELVVPLRQHLLSFSINLVLMMKAIVGSPN